MKKKLVQLMLMITAGVMLVVISVLAYSAAWFKAGVSHPYTFEILADGVVMVYMQAHTVESDRSLTPAVAIPGAIGEGLPYNVLVTHDEDSNSYIQKAASVADLEGDFTIYNEGYGYDPVPLAKDAETGGTLYPKVEMVDVGKFKVVSGYEYHYSRYLVVDEYGRYNVRDKDGNLLERDVNPDLFEPDDYIITDTDYEPKLDSSGCLILKEGKTVDMPMALGYEDDERKFIQYYVFDSRIYERREVPKETLHPATVHFELRFKETDDPDADDFYDPSSFYIRKIYFITKKDKEESVPNQYKNGVGDRVREYLTLSDDKKTGTFRLYGSEAFWVYAEVYFAQPDELLDPALREVDHVYMSVFISVEIEQYMEG